MSAANAPRSVATAGLPDPTQDPPCLAMTGGAVYRRVITCTHGVAGKGVTGRAEPLPIVSDPLERCRHGMRNLASAKDCRICRDTLQVLCHADLCCAIGQAPLAAC